VDCPQDVNRPRVAIHGLPGPPSHPQGVGRHTCDAASADADTPAGEEPDVDHVLVRVASGVWGRQQDLAETGHN